MKIALVHDWLVSMRGGEQVLEALCHLFPEAPIFTLVHNPGSVSRAIESHPIHTSFINRLPGKTSRYPFYLPLFPAAIEAFDLRGYNLIVSSSHCVAKGVRCPSDAIHLSYVHTPMRYVWDMYDAYWGAETTNVVIRRIMPFLATYLRQWDVASCQRVDGFIANSHNVARRIQRWYGRKARVIYPPVNTRLFTPYNTPGRYGLVVSALVPYKRVDLAVQVFNQRQEPLLVVGDGPEKKRLEKMAGPQIRFLPWQPQEALLALYRQCQALIFPGEEDFGLVPVEAMLCGKPVVAYGRGGALETVIGYDGTNKGRCTGVFFSEQTVKSLNRAVELCRRLPWDPAFIHRHAQRFSRNRFLNEMDAMVQQHIEAHFACEV